MKNLESDLLSAQVFAPRASARGRFYRRVGVSLAVVVLLAVGFHVAANAWLNRYGRAKVEQALAKHSPGSTLHLGALRYDFWRNHLQCESLELTTASGDSVRTGAVSVMGVQWTGLRASKPNLAQVLRHAQVEVAALSAGIAAGEYRLRCGHLRVSVPDAEFALHTLSLQPTVDDEAFFAADDFRRVRYRLALASGTARGVGFAELLAGRAYRVDSLELKSPVFESLVDREKPRRPSNNVPPMPHEALAAMSQPLRIGRFTMSDGSIQIAGRRFAGAEPGALTFTAVDVTATEIANVAAGGQAIGIQMAGKLMDAGALTVQMRVPVAADAFTFHYSGRLGAMDLTRLDGYLGGTGGFEIKSGRTDGASFDVDVVDGRAHGVLQGTYQDLQVTVLDRETGSEKGVTQRVATILANQIKVRHENLPDKNGALRDGKIDYARTPEDTFLMFAWNALRTGISDLLML